MGVLKINRLVMDQLKKLDKTYFKTILLSWWTMVGAVMGVLRIIEKWTAKTMGIPHELLITLAFVCFSLAQYRAFLKLRDAAMQKFKVPASTPFQEKEFEDIKRIVDGYGKECKTVLRCIMRKGKLTKHTTGAIFPPLEGLTEVETRDALATVVGHHLVTERSERDATGFEIIWEIPPNTTVS